MKIAKALCRALVLLLCCALLTGCAQEGGTGRQYKVYLVSKSLDTEFWQAVFAGANAAGDQVKYQPVPYGASFEGMNTASYAIGDVGRQNRDYRLVEFRDEVEGSYRKYWFFGRRLLGGILYGNMDRIQVLTEAVTAKSDYVQLKGKL